MRNSYKIFFLIAFSFLLTACNDQAQYRYWLTHPEKLQQTLITCQNDSQMHTSKKCLNALAAGDAIKQFVMVQREQSKRFPGAQEELMRYQEAMAQGENNSALKAEGSSEMSLINQYFLAMMEGYGNRILAMQEKLGKLIAQKDQATSEAEKKALNNKIEYYKKLTAAMNAMVYVNTGGQA